MRVAVIEVSLQDCCQFYYLSKTCLNRFFPLICLNISNFILWKFHYILLISINGVKDVTFYWNSLWIREWWRLISKCAWNIRTKIWIIHKNTINDIQTAEKQGRFKIIIKYDLFLSLKGNKLCLKIYIFKNFC